MNNIIACGCRSPNRLVFQYSSAEKYRPESANHDFLRPFEAMTDGIMALAAADRSYAAEVYDAVKQIPEFMQLVSHPKNATLFEAFEG